MTIFIEWCPPFQPKPKLSKRKSGGFHFLWLWLGLHYVPHSFNHIMETGVEMGYDRGINAAVAVLEDHEEELGERDLSVLVADLRATDWENPPQTREQLRQFRPVNPRA